MRIATLIISIFVCGATMLQSCSIFLLGSMSRGLGNDKGDNLASAGAIGILVSLSTLVGLAFVWGYPRFSLFVYLFGSLTAFAAGQLGFSDMNTWSVILIVLAVLSYFSWREKNSNKRKESADGLIPPSFARQDELPPPRYIGTNSQQSLVAKNRADTTNMRRTSFILIACVCMIVGGGIGLALQLPSVSQTLSRPVIEEAIKSKVQDTVAREQESSTPISNVGLAVPKTKDNQIQPTATSTTVGLKPGQIKQYIEGSDLIFIGLFTNTSEIALRDVQVLISLLDSQGKVVAVGELSSPSIRVVLPGDIYPFQIRVKTPPQAAVKSNIKIFSKPYDPQEDYIFPSYFAIKIDNTSMRSGSLNEVIVSGQVTNLGGKETFLIELILLLFDKDGQLIDIDSGYPKETNLLPGNSSPYEISLYGAKPGATSYRVMVQSNSKK